MLCLCRKILAGVALVATVFSSAPPVVAQSYPAPEQEAELYAGAKKEGTVVWYGGAPLDAMQAMAADFEAKYPGVKVEIIRIIGVAQYQRFMQETASGQHIADVLHVGDQPSMVDLIDKKLVVSWKVPTYDRVPDDAKISTYAYTSYFLTMAVGYNSNNITDEEAKLLLNWKGLLDPRFKGRIATSSQNSAAGISTNEMFLDPKYEAEYGKPFLKALAAQKLVVYNDIVTPADRVIAGEHDIVFITGDGAVYPKWKNGAPIRWVAPKPTPAFGSTWFSIPSQAPHPYAARLFLNWAMSEDGAKSVQQRYGGLSTLIGVPDERDIVKEPWFTPITDRYVPDWSRWIEGAQTRWKDWLDMVRAAQ